MPTLTADAALSSEFSIDARTAFVFEQEAILDPITGTVKATGTGTWAALAGTTWSALGSYTQQPNRIIWTAPMIDVGSEKYFSANVELDCDGTATLRIYTSTTGLFQGEETEYIISNGDDNITAFYGRFCYVKAYVDGSELRRMTITTETPVRSFRLQDINTATLAGTNTARQITLPETLSAITDIYIQPKAAASYTPNLYVSATATSEVVIPVVKSKTSTPTFALYGIDNEPRDAVVDIMVTGIPRMVMEGNNLFVIQ
jgi:hypothetical protein